ncbi:hypothetical protein JCM30760_00130 [Thiomicrorhabdus hydrogeniphila]
MSCIDLTPFLMLIVDLFRECLAKKKHSMVGTVPSKVEEPKNHDFKQGNVLRFLKLYFGAT